jgi:hypothetical protein
MSLKTDTLIAKKRAALPIDAEYITELERIIAVTDEAYVNLEDENTATLNQYFVAGRVCDQDDRFKLVEAKSKDEAKEKFEAYVRELEGIQDGDFYIEQCETIETMQQSIIK